MSVLRIGIGGPVGSGKTMLTWRLCQWLRDEYSLGVVTNDIFWALLNAKEFMFNH